MELTPPFPITKISQQFGQNQVNYSTIDNGLIGHPGQDYDEEWGTSVLNTIEGAIVSAVLSKDSRDLMQFRAVNTIFDDANDVSYEIQYGHLSDICVKPGDILKLGQQVGNVGNTGQVYTLGTNGKYRLVTEGEKEAGSRAGRHLHYQVRFLKRIPVGAPRVAGDHYLNDGTRELVLNGYVYQVPNWDNGENGCINPSLFFPIAPPPTFKFNKDLWFGKFDPDVIELQKRLHVSPTYLGFGPATLSAVIKYQKANGITPAVGYVGQITRASLNK